MKIFAYTVVWLLVLAGGISVCSTASQKTIENKADLSVTEPVCKSKPIQQAHDETFETRLFNDGPSDIFEPIEIKWYLDNNPVNVSQIGGLAEGNGRDVPGYIPWPDDWQSHTICVQVIVPPNYSDPVPSNNGECIHSRAVNTIQRHQQGIYLFGCTQNILRNSTFLQNQQPAFFVDSFHNTWNHNYWNHPRVLPKPIPGVILIDSLRFPIMKFDWNQAREPYNDG